MDDKLKPNQEKKVIENFVECIMDDLDYYHFDELIIEKYKKELFQFFTKISEEHSLFSPGFDFSNKKNIVNDKEKTKEVLELLNKLIENNEKKGSEWRRSENSLVSIIYTDQIKELEAIKKILEK